MARPVTLFTGQWADLSLADLAPFAAEAGYDGLELACWGDHFDVAKAIKERGYCAQRHAMLADSGLRVWAISNHLVGQAVADVIDARHKSILPRRVWGDGDAAGVRKRAQAEMIATIRAAAKLGVGVVNGFTGSPIWHMLYFFPPTPPKVIDAGYREFARLWKPILDVAKREGVRFALEVHPTEIAYDIHTAERAIDALEGHEAFGFNFDPSHLHWQGVDPVAFIDRFGSRVFHVHMKDCRVNGGGSRGGEASILGGHLQFGDHRRAWDFRSVGRGEIDFDAIVRALNRVGYVGPLSVEWEDPDMAREHGAIESCEYVRGLDFPPSSAAFDAAFDAKKKIAKRR